MDATQKVATGIASIIALGMLTFTSVSADSSRPASRAAEVPAYMSVNGPETHQDLTWDMTYGQLTASVVMADVVLAEVSEDDVSDLSMG